jgi:hypothetical protein
MTKARRPLPFLTPWLAALSLALVGCGSATTRTRTGAGTGGEGDPVETGGNEGRATGGTVGRDASGGQTGARDASGSPDREAPATGGQGGATGGAGGATSPADGGGGSADAGTSKPDVPPAGTGGAGGSSPLTAGWREAPFEFSIHKPYDLPESARHSYDAATNTHTFWVLKTDKPHDPPPNTTAPRTELRMKNDYTSGLHQFEADMYVVAGTDGPSIMQVFGGSAHATAFMLKAYGGSLKHYDRETVLTDAYEKWLHLNVIHNADTGEVKAYIDNRLVGTFKDNGPATHYFKCGVYGPNSPRVETRFRNIKNWVK